MTNATTNHTAIVANEMKNAGFLVEIAGDFVVVGLNRNVSKREILTAMDNAEMPTCRVINAGLLKITGKHTGAKYTPSRWVMGKVAIDCTAS